MSNQIFLPESTYGVDYQMTHKKLNTFYENHSSVTGRVIRLDALNQTLEVDLGGDITAVMTFEDSTIYPIYRSDGSLSPNIYELVGKIIRAKIESFYGSEINLSRKINMLEALEDLKSETKIKSATITGFSDLSVFLDIGAGITGRMYGKELAPTVYQNVKDLGFRKGDVMSVTIKSYLEEAKHFELSRMDTIPDICYVYNEGDVVVCKVFDSVKDVEGIGYFVAIDNNKYCGIVDSPEFKLKYGDEIVAILSKMSKKGPRLDFVRKI